MSDWTAKRFWTDATVLPESDGFTVQLDARPLRTPAKAHLVVPTQAMAQVIADEWMAQGDTINPLSMPYTRSANAAIDKVKSNTPAVIDMIAAYGDSDLICYRAAHPEELVARQSAAWDPLIAYSANDLDAPLHVHTGVMHHRQSPDTLNVFQHRVSGFTAFQLTAFHDLVSLSGSLVIGFAVVDGIKPALDLFDVSRIDELWQQQQWGEDEEALQQAQIRREAFCHAERFLRLCL